MNAAQLRAYARRWQALADEAKAVHDALMRDRETVPRLTCAIDAANIMLGLAAAYQLRADLEELSR